MCAPLEMSVPVRACHCTLKPNKRAGDRFIFRLCKCTSVVFFYPQTRLPEPRARVVHKYIVIVMVYALPNVHAVQPNKLQQNKNMLVFCNVLHGQKSHRSRGDVKGGGGQCAGLGNKRSGREW